MKRLAVVAAGSACRVVGVGLSFAIALGACGAPAPPVSSGAGERADGSFEQAIAATMADARTALAEHGETPAAMERIQIALARLAAHPELQGRAPAGEMHGSSAMRAEVLASDGDDALTLVYVRFSAGSATPVHDHLTWGVVRVTEGQDRYVEWERTDDGSDPEAAILRSRRDVVLGPGDSVYWLAPPHDLHSQAPVDGDATELVIAGKNLLGDVVLHHRHYYDPETGRVTRPASR